MLDVSLRWHERLNAFIVADGAAFVFIDTNSDGREIEMRSTPKGRTERGCSLSNWMTWVTLGWTRSRCPATPTVVPSRTTP
jgi:hypothetical protein